MASYPRLRAEVLAAVGEEHATEFQRLFPVELATEGQPWGTRAGEVKLYVSQIAGWLDGMIEAAMMERQIQADADARAKRVGFE